MSFKDDLTNKIAADREAGRDIPLVIEELILMVAEFVEPSEKKEDEPEPEFTEKPVETKDETENLNPRLLAPAPATTVEEK